MNPINVNIKQVHHYTRTANYNQPSNPDEEKKPQKEETLNFLFPDANNYDSEETVKEKSGFSIYI